LIKKLVVIARHFPSVLIEKGEYVPRYYNPGNVFDEVHLLLTNDDQPNIKAFKHTASEAKLFVHNLPRPDFLRTLGWRSWLIRGWIEEAVEIVEKIQPQLIRVHNNFLEGYLGQCLRETLGVPYLVSIHHSEHQFRTTIQRKLLGVLLRRYEYGSLQEANGVIAVYQSNYNYAEQLKGNDPRLIYNQVSDQIPVKSDYSLSTPPKIITINQQKDRKNPQNIIRAIADIDCEYWLVGNGPLHQELVDLARELGVEEKVHFYTSIDNHDLTEMLRNCDLHVSHCDVWGMSKTVVESSMAALPTLINNHPRLPIPEYDDSWIMRCDNTPESYREHILRILGDESLRRKIGQSARAHAKKNFDPVLMEMRLADLYQEKMLSAE